LDLLVFLLFLSNDPLLNCYIVTLIQNIVSFYTDKLISDELQGGSNMTGTDLYVNKPHCAAAVRP